MTENSHHVALRPIEKDDLRRIVSWLNDKEIADSLILNRNISYEQELVWYENYLSDDGKKVFAIEANGNHVGNISLFNIDRVNRRALMSIFIGEEKFRGNGIGSEAVRQLFDIAIRETSLQRIGIETLADNIRAIKCYEKAGARKEGIMRSYVNLNGIQRDMVIMSFVHGGK
jgi:RimJ/RimL family protein N-acetyltransferase